MIEKVSFATHIPERLTTQDFWRGSTLQLKNFSLDRNIRFVAYAHNGYFSVENTKINRNLNTLIVGSALVEDLVLFKLEWEHDFFSEYYGRGEKIFTISDGKLLLRQIKNRDKFKY